MNLPCIIYQTGVPENCPDVARAPAFILSGLRARAPPHLLPVDRYLEMVLGRRVVGCLCRVQVLMFVRLPARSLYPGLLRLHPHPLFTALGQHPRCSFAPVVITSPLIPITCNLAPETGPCMPGEHYCCPASVLLVSFSHFLARIP